MPVFTSDDGGWTYNASTGSGSATMPFKGLAECQIVELNNGSVMVNARNEIRSGVNEPHHRAVAISNNGGTTFGAYYFSEQLVVHNFSRTRGS